MLVFFKNGRHDQSARQKFGDSRNLHITQNEDPIR